MVDVHLLEQKGEKMATFEIIALALAALGLAWGVMELLRGKRDRRRHHRDDDGGDVTDDVADDVVTVLTSIADDDDD